MHEGLDCDYCGEPVLMGQPSLQVGMIHEKARHVACDGRQIWVLSKPFRELVHTVPGILLTEWTEPDPHAPRTICRTVRPGGSIWPHTVCDCGRTIICWIAASQPGAAS